MTVVVAAGCGEGVVVVADSLRVDLSPLRVGACRKVVKEGSRVAGLAGVADYEGFDFLEVLADALRTVPDLSELPHAFAVACAGVLPAAFLRWRELTGGGQPNEGFHQILAGEAGTEGVRVLHAMSVVLPGADGPVLSYAGETIAASDRPQVLAAGATDVAFPYTVGGQLAAEMSALQHGALTVPEPVIVPATLDELNGLAHRLVEDTLAHRSSVPVPDWWPANVPPVAGPVQSVAARSQPR